jgi:tRNA threonylcarbamoyladenosine biosynthesis protein TsaE
LWFRSPGPEATQAAAARLAEAIGPEGAVLALVGPLGAGKTCFVKGLAAGLGVDPARVVSPTFVIASEYETGSGGRLAHVDLYRLASAAELDAAGFPDLLVPGTVVAVEWADRFPEALPADRLTVRFSRPAGAAEARELEASAQGDGSGALLERWSRALG